MQGLWGGGWRNKQGFVGLEGKHTLSFQMYLVLNPSPELSPCRVLCPESVQASGQIISNTFKGHQHLSRQSRLLQDDLQHIPHFSEMTVEHSSYRDCGHPRQHNRWHPDSLKSTLIICKAKMSEAIRGPQMCGKSPSLSFPLTPHNSRQQASKLLSCARSKPNNYNLSGRINFPISHKDV